MAENSKKTGKSSNLKGVLLVMIAIVAGFFGGWFGSRAEVVTGSTQDIKIQN